MSHATSHAALEELRTRWEREGFVRKGQEHMARVVPEGLQIVSFGMPGSWRTAVSVSFAVWHAAFERRTTGAPTPWPLKRFRLPEEKRWLKTVMLSELPGGPANRYVDGSAATIVGTIWNVWGGARTWLEQHTDIRQLAALSVAAGTHDSSYGSWRHFQTAALCFLELGQPERVEALMLAELDYYHRPAVTAGGTRELLVGWWDRSAAWWREVAGLRPPTYDGDPNPDAITSVPPPPPTPTPRDSIWYASQITGEWMKTREPQDAVDKVMRLLAMTTFEIWDEATLTLNPAPTPELAALDDYLRRVPDGVNLWDWREQVFDRAALASHGIEPDPVLADAIERFGAPRFRRWCSLSGGDWRGSRFWFWWTRKQLTLPSDWFAFCDLHREVRVLERAYVEVTLRTPSFTLLDPKTKAPLPFQGDLYCPPSENTPSWPSSSSLTLHLPECRMDLRARLPFTRVDAAFRRYYDRLNRAVGYTLSPTHFRALLINKEGTRAYDRKLAW